jgi:hypothetical protein
MKKGRIAATKIRAGTIEIATGKSGDRLAIG